MKVNTPEQLISIFDEAVIEAKQRNYVISTISPDKTFVSVNDKFFLERNAKICTPLGAFFLIYCPNFTPSPGDTFRTINQLEFTLTNLFQISRPDCHYFIDGLVYTSPNTLISIRDNFWYRAARCLLLKYANHPKFYK